MGSRSNSYDLINILYKLKNLELNSTLHEELTINKNDVINSKIYFEKYIILNNKLEYMGKKNSTFTTRYIYKSGLMKNYVNRKEEEIKKDTLAGISKFSEIEFKNPSLMNRCFINDDWPKEKNFHDAVKNINTFF